MTEQTFGGGKRHKPGTGGVVGVGYISIMLIFTVICLTIFAVLSFQAAYSNDRLSVLGEEFTRQYYAADMQAKKILSELDCKSAKLLGEFHYGEELAAAAEEISGGTALLTAKDGRECVLVNYSVEMNDRRRLSVSVLFYTSVGEYRYEILSWKTTTDENPADSHPNVWDGGDIDA